MFFFSLVGLILGLVAQSQSKTAGTPNTPAKVAVILGIIFLALQVFGGIVGALFVLPLLGVQIGYFSYLLGSTLRRDILGERVSMLTRRNRVFIIMRRYEFGQEEIPVQP